MPRLGFETGVLPMLGRFYLAGATGIAQVVASIYLGPATVVFLSGLPFLAIGVVYLALPTNVLNLLPRDTYHRSRTSATIRTACSRRYRSRWHHSFRCSQRSRWCSPSSHSCRSLRSLKAGTSPFSIFLERKARSPVELTISTVSTK